MLVLTGSRAKEGRVELKNSSRSSREENSANLIFDASKRDVKKGEAGSKGSLRKCTNHFQTSRRY